MQIQQAHASIYHIYAYNLSTYINSYYISLTLYLMYNGTTIKIPAKSVESWVFLF